MPLLWPKFSYKGIDKTWRSTISQQRRYSKTEISFYKGADTCSTSSSHSHCSVSGTSSISSNSKTTDSRICNYKIFRFNDSFDGGSKKRTAMVGGEPTTNQRENIDKFNISQCFFGKLRGLLLRSVLDRCFNFIYKSRSTL